MEIQAIGQNLTANLPNKSNSFTKSKGMNAKSGNVSFQGGIADKATKYGWYSLRSLSKSMAEITEITNAVIAAIGTGIIAPFIILASPGKGDKEDKDKKFFQAIRQPLSAMLALSFQLPATMLINKGIDWLAYKKHVDFFSDDVIGSLVPDKKYIKKDITKEELNEWSAKFDKVVDGKSLKAELEDKIRQEYKEAGINVSEEKVAKRVAKEKIEFLKNKIADDRHNKFLNAKIEELKGQKFEIKDIDLVTDDYRQLAIHKNKNAYKALEENANLSFFDKLARILGFSTKKTQALGAKQKALANEKGLELLRINDPKLFTNEESKFKRFIQNCEEASRKSLKNKKFWLTLGVNLFMVTASCFALNWAHPRLKELIDKHKNANQQSEDKKVEGNA